MYVLQNEMLSPPKDKTVDRNRYVSAAKLYIGDNLIMFYKWVTCWVG